MGAYEDYLKKLAGAAGDPYSSDYSPATRPNVADATEPTAAEFSAPEPPAPEPSFYDANVAPVLHGIGELVGTPYRKLSEFGVNELGLEQAGPQPSFGADVVKTAGEGIAELLYPNIPTPRPDPEYYPVLSRVQAVAEPVADLAYQAVADPVNAAFLGAGALARGTGALAKGAAAVERAAGAALVPGMVAGAVESGGRAVDLAGERGLTDPETLRAGAEAVGAGAFATMGVRPLAEMAGSIAKDIVRPTPAAETAPTGELAEAFATEAAGPRDDVDTLGFYSQLRRTTDAFPQRAAKAEDWRRYLTDPKRGVKADEIKWTGLDDFLQERAASGQGVTKQEVQEFLQQNEVRVEETTLGEKGPEETSRAGWNAIREMDDLGFDSTAQAVAAVRQSAREEGVDAAMQRYDIDPQHAVPLREMLFSAGRPTKFQQYQTPGGENYRELLLTLPARGDAAVAQREEMAQRVYGQPYRELAIGNREWVDSQAGAPPGFRGGHFDEPNVLAHVRFNERTDADGKKVLFIEEVQSDWAQKGRREGFGPKVPMDFRIEPPATGRGDWQLINDADNGHVLAAGPEDAVRQAANEIMVSHKSRGIPSAPFVGKTEAWTELAMKRMVRWAAEHGFDRVAWTTGEQQAARYDLSKHLTALDVEKTPRGQYRITAKTKNGDTIPLEGDDLAGTVGKELADRIQNDPSPQQHYEGLDLKVGGEGMRGFYDQILPQVAGKLGKKFGAAVRQGDAGVMESAPFRYEGPEISLDEFWSRTESLRQSPHTGDPTADWSAANISSQTYAVREAMQKGASFSEAIAKNASPKLAEMSGGRMVTNRSVPVHTLDITDAMRASVTKEGQPRFVTEGQPDAAAPAATKPPGVRLTHEVVQKALPGLDVVQTGDGSYVAHLKDGRALHINEVGELTLAPDANAAAELSAKEAGLQPGKKGRQVGSYKRIGKDSIIRISKMARDTQATVDHEGFHFFFDLALTPKEQAAVLRHFKNEEAAAYAYAKWEPAKQVNGWFTKILAFAKRLYHSFNPTWESTFAGVRKGRAGERVAAERGQAQSLAAGERFATEEGVPAKKLTKRETNLRNWFGQSKAVDDVGNPLTLYHGTSERGLDRLSPRRAVETPGVVFLSSNPDVANTFTLPREYGEPIYEDASGREIRPGPVHEVYAKIENPLVLEGAEAQRATDDTTFQGEIVRRAKAAGHDGIILRGVREGIGETSVGDTYGIFDATQVKAVKNKGTFDPNDPRMKFATEAQGPGVPSRRLTPSDTQAIEPIRPDQEFTPDEFAEASRLLIESLRPKLPRTAPETAPSAFARGGTGTEGRPGGREGVPASEAPDIGLNLEKMGDWDPELKGRVGEVMQEINDKLKRGTTQHWADVDPAVDRIFKTTSPEELVARLNRRGGLPTQPELKAMRIGAEAFWRDTDKAYKAWQAEPQNRKLEAEYVRKNLHATAFEMYVTDQKTAAGRLLQSLRETIRGDKDAAEFDIGRLTRALKKRGVSDSDAAALLHIYRNSPHEFASALRTAFEPTWRDKLMYAYRAHLLSGAPTTWANALGNTGSLFANVLETAMSGAVESLESAVGKRTIPASERQRFSSDAQAQARAISAVLPAATKRLWRDLKDITPGFAKSDPNASRFSIRDEPISMEQVLEHKAPPQGGKISRYYWKAAGRAYQKLKVWDDFFGELINAGEWAKLANREARRRGFQGQEATDYAQRWLQDNKRIAEHAETVSKEVDRQLYRLELTKDRGMLVGLGGFAQDFTRRFPLAQSVLPFIRTPTNILDMTLRFTPRGLIVEPLKWAKSERALRELEGKRKELGQEQYQEQREKLVKERGEMLDRAGASLAGTAFFIPAFYALAQSGLLTGSGPKDARERQLKLATGWRPYSLKIGDAYLPLNRIEPIGTLLGYTADLAEMRAGLKEGGTSFANIVGMFAENAKDKPFMVGLSNIVDFYQSPSKFLNRFATRTLGAAVPTGVSKLAQAYDPIIRDTSADTLLEEIGNTLVSRIPGASETLPARLTATGKEAHRGGEGVIGAASRLLSPVQYAREEEDTDVEREMVRIGYVPSPPRRDIRLPGGTRLNLSVKDYRKLLSYYDEAAKEVGRLMDTAAYRQLPDTVAQGGSRSKEAAVKRIYDKYRDEGRMELYQDLQRRRVMPTRPGAPAVTR